MVAKNVEMHDALPADIAWSRAHAHWSALAARWNGATAVALPMRELPWGAGCRCSNQTSAFDSLSMCMFFQQLVFSASAA